MIRFAGNRCLAQSIAAPLLHRHYNGNKEAEGREKRLGDQRVHYNGDRSEQKG
jgi:hypothetical protein